MHKRIEYIDVAKFLAMVLVVFTHGIKESNFVAFVFAFHVPLFFFLNGITLKLNSPSFGDFLVKKLQRYIIPMLGLGFFCILFDWLIRWLLNSPIPDYFFLKGIANIINQVRMFAIWFLPALFFSDIILYGFHRFSKGRISIMGVLTLLLLSLGILFNLFHNVALVWNIDAAFFGTFFTYCGFAFHHKKLSSLYNFLTTSRVRATLIGLFLMGITYFISQHNYTLYYPRHLEMFARFYLPYYSTIPGAVIGSIGFLLLCRGISNPLLAKPVEINLALLAFHQPLAFPIFRSLLFPNWWAKVSALPVSDLSYILFDCGLTLFAIGLISIIHIGIKYSPLSAIVNQPLPTFYKSTSQDLSCFRGP